MPKTNTLSLSDIVDQINALAFSTQEYFDKAIAKGDMTALLVAYLELDTKYKALDEARKRIYKIDDWLNKNVIPAEFERIGQDKIQVPSVAKSFYPLTKYSASIKDKERGFEWLRSQGLGAIITETVNAGTLASALKDLVTEKGVDPDPEVIQFTTYYATGMSNYTPKADK